MQRCGIGQEEGALYKQVRQETVLDISIQKAKERVGIEERGGVGTSKGGNREAGAGDVRPAQSQPSLACAHSKGQAAL